MSNWYNGNFISGTAYGMIFSNGVSNYMNAYNVIWEGGTWKNGNWHGSEFEYNGGFLRNDGTTNNFTYNIVRRGFRDYGLNTSVYPDINSGTSSFQTIISSLNFNYGLNNLHVWNLFGNTQNTVNLLSSNVATHITFDLSIEDLSTDTSIITVNHWDPDQPYQPYIGPLGPVDSTPNNTFVAVTDSGNIDTNQSLGSSPQSS